MISAENAGLVPADLRTPLHDIREVIMRLVDAALDEVQGPLRLKAVCVLPMSKAGPGDRRK